MKSVPGIDRVNKCIKHNQKHDKAEDGKGLKIALYNEAADVPERIDVDFTYKGKSTHGFLIWIQVKTRVSG